VPSADTGEGGMKASCTTNAGTRCAACPGGCAVPPAA